MTKKRALVTGACGFVGSHFVDQLLQDSDYEVQCTDLAEADRSFLNTEAKFLPGDLCELQTLSRIVEGVDVIFHAASLFRYSASWEDLFAVNVEGTMNLCRAALKAGVSKLVLISTAGVYGVPESLPVVEDDLPNPSNKYEQSKLEQEEVVQTFCTESKLDFLILRPAPIYGPRNRYGIGSILRMVALGQLPIISENLNTLVPLVHVTDVVGAALHLVALPKAQGQVYNVVDDSSYHKYELFSHLAPLLNTKIYYTRFPLLPRWLLRALAFWAEWKARNFTHKEPKLERATIDLMYHDYQYSNEKLKATGYKLVYPDSRLGLEETISWFQTHNWFQP
ncbi:MAG: NAD-dependent epimerase/dehydratase family protein [Candidatus Hermodarchaeia archaeon]